jgi:hypothetical protein
VRNILATSAAPRRFAGCLAGALAITASLLGSTLWGAWATHKIVTLERREVVTVQLSRIMGDFVEAEARSGRPPKQMKARVETYLKAVEASVAKLGKQGRTVLVAEAVVAGTVPDLTGEVRADVARAGWGLSPMPAADAPSPRAGRQTFAGWPRLALWAGLGAARSRSARRQLCQTHALMINASPSLPLLGDLA